MATDVLNSFNALQNALNQAKNSLKDYDESIKKLIGRDPSELGSRNNKRSGPSGNPPEDFRGRHTEAFSARFNENATATNRYNDNNFSRQRITFPNRNQTFESEEPQAKKRSIDSSVFKRLDKPRQIEDDDYPNKPQMFSRVIVTPRETPSRQDALKAQDRDEKSKARNRRMFGALLGTLQKFRQEETKLKTKEDKRAQVEKKLEEQEIQEKAKVKKERYELFLARKKKQQEIRLIEQKMLRIKEQTFWEEQQKPLVNFIRTAAKPHIFYLPRRMNTATRGKLAESKKHIQKLIEDKQQNLQQELDALENRYKKGEHKETEDGEIDEQDMSEMLVEETEPILETVSKEMAVEIIDQVEEGEVTTEKITVVNDLETIEDSVGETSDTKPKEETTNDHPVTVNSESKENEEPVQSTEELNSQEES